MTVLKVEDFWDRPDDEWSLHLYAELFIEQHSADALVRFRACSASLIKDIDIMRARGVTERQERQLICMEKSCGSPSDVVRDKFRRENQELVQRRMTAKNRAAHMGISREERISNDKNPKTSERRHVNTSASVFIYHGLSASEDSNLLDLMDDTSQAGASDGMCLPGIDDDLGPIPPQQNLQSDLGDFDPVISRILLHQSTGGFEAAQTPLFWGALTLPTIHDAARNSAVENSEFSLLCPATRESVVMHCQGIISQAAGSLSKSCIAFICLTRTIMNNVISPEIDLTVQNFRSSLMKAGIPGIAALLKSRLDLIQHYAGLDAELGADDVYNVSDDDLCEPCPLQQLAQAYTLLADVDPSDEETNWVVDRILWLDGLQGEPMNPTERTVDIFHIVPFAISKTVQLRYGDGESKADSDDKTLRLSSSGGKKVDYLHLVDGREFGSGENSRRGYEHTDFIAGIKCAIAQLRSLKRELGPTLAQHPLVERQFYSGVPVCFYQIRQHTIEFRVLFNIGSELYAWGEWAKISIAENLPTCLDAAENFLIAKHIMETSSMAFQHVLKQLRARVTMMTSWRGKGTDGLQLNIAKRTRWTPPQNSPVPAATPKKSRKG
ncbi:hypothetical protein HDU85_002716 [Gaertneriomyces sp. JEL0708]|nr:hypothetical protein HDU85_002716 [Gaertneriomyces sp. JEL0708]